MWPRLLLSKGEGVYHILQNGVISKYIGYKGKEATQHALIKVHWEHCVDANSFIFLRVFFVGTSGSSL